MALHLTKFKKSEIVLGTEDAKQVLSFFFNSVPPIPTLDDRGFAQALLLEALDASYKMGFLESLFRALVKLPQGLPAVIRTFAVKSAKHWYKHNAKVKQEIIDNPKIYENIRNRLIMNFRSVWEIRMSGGGLMY